MPVASLADGDGSAGLSGNRLHARLSLLALAREAAFSGQGYLPGATSGISPILNLRPFRKYRPSGRYPLGGNAGTPTT